MNSSTKSRREKIFDFCLENPTYPPQAYFFVCSALSTAVAEHEAIERQRAEAQHRLFDEQSMHVSGQFLIQSFRNQLLKEFGPFAIDVLTRWNISKTEDFGEIIFALVDLKILSLSENDRKEDFANGYDFIDTFVMPYAF